MTFAIPPVTLYGHPLPIHESFNGDFRQLLPVCTRLQSCNSGVIFTAFTHHRAHTLPGSLSAFPCNYSLHQRFCGHIIYLTMRIHYKVTKFTVSSIFLNIRVILLLFNNTSRDIAKLPNSNTLLTHYHINFTQAL